MESIFDLMARIREHPDYVWGTVFVKADVVEALNDLCGDRDESYVEVTEDDLTAGQYVVAGRAIESSFFNGISSWMDAVVDGLEPWLPFDIESHHLD